MLISDSGRTSDKMYPVIQVNVGAEEMLFTLQAVMKKKEKTKEKVFTEIEEYLFSV